MSVNGSTTSHGSQSFCPKPMEQQSVSFEWRTLLKEVRSVSAWMTAASLFRVLLAFLIQLDSYEKDSADNQCESSFPVPTRANLSILVGLVLSALPRRVASGTAPGFVYAFPWLLMKTDNTFGSLPNVPLRVTEAVLGRLTFQELLFLLPIHYVCAISTVVALRWLLSADFQALAFEPIVYSLEETWLLTMAREALATCCFCVTFLVLPQLLALNKLPRWSCILFLYPIYNMSIDSSGKGSTFGPNVVYALAALSSSENTVDLWQPVAQLVGSIVGGLLGGLTMRRFFPDDL